jgi:hypothetical protein
MNALRLFCAASLALSAPSALADEVSASVEPTPHAWGLEVEVVQPFIPTVNLTRLRATRALWGTPTGLRGEVLFGVYVRPDIPHDVVERISEYMLVAGYRQYFWRGLHADLSLEGGLAWGTNRFDGKFYRTPTLFLNANVGYRFGFFEPQGFFADRASPVGFFVIPQFGTLASLGVANIGPRNGKPDVFLQGNLLVGLSF